MGLDPEQELLSLADEKSRRAKLLATARADVAKDAADKYGSGDTLPSPAPTMTAVPEPVESLLRSTPESEAFYDAIELATRDQLADTEPQ